MTKQEILGELLQDTKLRGLSVHTQEEYYTKAKQFQDFYDKPATELDVEDVRNFLYYLFTEKNLASGTVNTYNSGLRFLYNITLDMPINIFKIPRHKRNRKIPEILTRDEIQLLFDSCDNLRDKCMLMTMYSAGLRVSELTHLRVKDIDSKKMQIFISQGKGKKDRFAILSKSNLEILREYWLKYKLKGYLFYSRNCRVMTNHAFQDLFHKHIANAGITKEVTPHSLRHAFATHLLEDGVSIFYIKQLLGHSDISTTCFYLRLVKISELDVKSPLDSVTLKDNQNE